MEYTLLLEDNVSGICERSAMKKKFLEKIIIIISKTTLPSAHIPFTGVNTPHLNCGAPMVLSLLPLSNFLGGPLPFLVPGGDFLALQSHDLRTLQ